MIGSDFKSLVYFKILKSKSAINKYIMKQKNQWIPLDIKEDEEPKEFLIYGLNIINLF